MERRAGADRRVCSSGGRASALKTVRTRWCAWRWPRGATSNPAAGLHRFLRCPEHVPVRPPAWDQEPSAHRTTVAPSAMSRFQSPTQGCPSHSRFPAHPASASATSSAGTSFPPFIATSHVDGNPENAHSVAGTAPPGWVPKPGGPPGLSGKRCGQRGYRSTAARPACG
jgi:hypothetical protein